MKVKTKKEENKAFVNPVTTEEAKNKDNFRSNVKLYM